jgi:aryl-alcohol dehydrogenase-like predicted oxidoreductase
MTLPQDGLTDADETARVEEAAFGAMEEASKQGKVRFSGLSTHNRPWLKSMIGRYPDHLQVACTPYTANSKELPGDNVFAAIREFDAGIFGIKPFADNSLFKGDSSLDSPHCEEDNRRAPWLFGIFSAIPRSRRPFRACSIPIRSRTLPRQ